MENVNQESFVKRNEQNDALITGNDFWITGLRVISWIIFAAIIFVGLVMGVDSMNSGENLIGVFIMLLSFIVGFLSVAIIMVFLNLAQDIAILREIRQRDYYEGTGYQFMK